MVALGESFDYRAAGSVQMGAIEELQQWRQWLCWRYKDIRYPDGSSRKTKPPVHPITGRGASHSNPDDWASFGEAQSTASRLNLPGIGFVLSDDDDYTGIDLDKCRDPETGVIEPWAQEILDLGETYAEISPSGTGIRLIARGKVSGATKVDAAHIEIYASQRYLTITQNRCEESPDAIRPAPKTLALLMERAAQFRPVKEPLPNSKAAPRVNKIATAAGEAANDGERSDRRSDFFENVNQLALASLGAWVTSIFTTARYQDGTGAYRVTSKDLGRMLQEDLSLSPEGIVDFGVHDMGDPRQGARTAIDIVIEWGGAADAKAAAFWLCERLGRTPESMGWSGGIDPAMVALGTQVGQLYEKLAGGEIVDTETGEIVCSPTNGVDPAQFPEHLTYVPGLLGDMIEFMVDTSSEPCRQMALASAISVVGTAAGRWWSGPTDSSTTLFTVCLAETAFGKNHYIERVKLDLMPAGGMTEHIGAGRFMSMSAIFNSIARKPLSLNVMDELGKTLARTRGKHANSHEQGITDSLLDLWGVKFGVLGGSEMAQQQAVQLHAPAFNILGFSTPKVFWEALTADDITSGFANRLLIFPIKGLRPRQKPRLPPRSPVPESIGHGLDRIYAGGNRAVAGSTCIAAEMQVTNINHGRVIPVQVPWSDESLEQEYWQYAEEQRLRPESERDYYGRVAESGVRLATIYALSKNPINPIVDREAWEWGRDVALWCIDALVIGSRDYMASTQAQANALHVLREIKKGGGTMKRSRISETLRNRFTARELDEILASLVDSAALIVQLPPKGKSAGRPALVYTLGPNA